MENAFERMTEPTRRSVIASVTSVCTAGLLGTLGAASASANAASGEHPETGADLGLEIGTVGQTTLLREPNVTSSGLNPRFTDPNAIMSTVTVPFGGDADYVFRITREGSDDAVRFEPDDDAATREIRSIFLETGYDPTDSMDESAPVPVSTGIADDVKYVEGRFVGDLEVFDREPFARYRAALLDETGTVFVESPPTRVATRYEWSLAQSDETLRITRDPATPADLYVEFSVYERSDRAEGELGRTAVDNAGDEFVVDLSQFDLDLETERYHWRLEFAESADARDTLLVLDSNDGRLALPYEGESAESLSGPGFVGAAGGVAGAIGGLAAYRRRTR